ncbi:DNA polymerase-3 subunit epsilon [Pseudoclavibacter chungangensis]|nr:exonuclease domain-containing protein [Pseudoclavibacter chungangensis]NYJ65376.1 DNA polymerase-3 subunit epsilon [Pseudoclavibacter chungangensis]
MTGYTVIDLETTGVAPHRNDRIVEIALVHVSADGRVEDTWSSLVNPLRDLGPVGVHRISPRDVEEAPTFEALAPAVLERVRGRTLVAHNAGFDTGFLVAELERAGLVEAGHALPAVCTMQWANRFLTAPSRKLADCCAAAGIELQDAHSALGDAVATAHLLAHYIASSDEVPWRETLRRSADYPWPDVTVPGAAPHPRELAVAISPGDWVSRIPDHDEVAHEDATTAYLALLDRTLVDGSLAVHDTNALVATATEHGLARRVVLAVHADHLVALAGEELEHGFGSRRSRRRLERAAIALGLGESSVRGALDRAAEAPTATRPTVIALRPGDRIVFSGELDTDRDVWARRIAALGLTTGGVTKTTRFVVTTDPDSRSGKCMKAREFGVPIVSEATFERLLRDHGLPAELRMGA